MFVWDIFTRILTALMHVFTRGRTKASLLNNWKRFVPCVCLWHVTVRGDYFHQVLKLTSLVSFSTDHTRIIWGRVRGRTCFMLLKESFSSITALPAHKGYCMLLPWKRADKGFHTSPCPHVTGCQCYHIEYAACISDWKAFFVSGSDRLMVKANHVTGTDPYACWVRR
jgi:hypothetical protein